jgi:pimeloyl-ACP methyl ester carboxylesterase
MLDAQGIGRFATVGWSGGGPHALACAALAPDRCVSALSLAGVAPYLPGEFDWLEGMGEDNVEEFTLAMQAGPRYDESLEAARELLLAVDPTTVTSARDLFGGLVSDVDNDAASKEDVRFVCDLAQRGIRSGVGGWRDDDQSFLHPWGFDVDSIDVPVGVWFGDHDLMVPPRHGEWLVEHLGRVTPMHVHDGGHLSIVFGHFDEILGEVRQLAGGSW